MDTARRTHGFRESVIRGMTRLAREHRSINLAQGFPNFPAPELLKDAASRAIHDDINQYAITWGAQRLRHSLARKYHQWYGLEVDPEREITVTCGATEAMISSLLALVDPGDEVIVFEPFYENYGPDTILADAKPVYVPLEPGMPLDLDRLRAAFSSRTRAIIVNTPSNPAGRVLTRPELEAISALCVRHNALAITDEIYEHILYEGEHIPIATLPGMRDRTITISGASKTFSVTGWRIGWIVAPAVPPMNITPPAAATATTRTRRTRFIPPTFRHDTVNYRRRAVFTCLDHRSTGHPPASMKSAGSELRTRWSNRRLTALAVGMSWRPGRGQSGRQDAIARP